MPAWCKTVFSLSGWLEEAPAPGNISGSDRDFLPRSCLSSKIRKFLLRSEPPGLAFHSGNRPQMILHYVHCPYTLLPCISTVLATTGILVYHYPYFIRFHTTSPKNYLRFIRRRGRYNLLRRYCEEHKRLFPYVKYIILFFRKFN